MNRRALMKAIFGGAAAASAGIRPQDIVGAVPSGANTLSVSSGAIGLVAQDIDPIQAMMREKAWKLQTRLREQREKLSYTPTHMPPHIQSKKSWSPVYRHSQWMQELQQLQDAINALDDASLGAKIFDVLTGGDE